MQINKCAKATPMSHWREIFQTMFVINWFLFTVRQERRKSVFDGAENICISSMYFG